MNAVGWAVPFHWITLEEMKFEPFTVRVKAPLPALALVGEMFVIVGTGLVAALMSKTDAGEVPPPGAGLVTVICEVPEAAMSAALMAAEICVALTKVVVREVPFQFTVEVLMKFVPLTVSVKAAAPEVTLVGESEEIVGEGLLVAVMVKVACELLPPPGTGEVTVTGAVPAVAMSAAVIPAVN